MAWVVTGTGAGVVLRAARVAGYIVALRLAGVYVTVLVRTEDVVRVAAAREITQLIVWTKDAAGIRTA